jgi:hypothetical protein
MEPESHECLDVGRHRVISEIAGDDLLQPLPLFRDRLVQSSPQFLLDLLEFRRFAVSAGFPVDQEVAPSRGGLSRLWGSDSRGQVGGVSSPIPTRRKTHAVPDPQPMKHPTRHTLLSSTPPKSRRSPPGPLRRLQRQTWFQPRPALPCRRSRLRVGHSGLTPNRSAVPYEVAPDSSARTVNSRNGASR